MIKSTGTQLKRSLSLWQLTLYGIGTILGAGVYVLIGEVAATAGLLAPVSFFVAAVLAAFTGLTFAELSSRFPFSAGEAVYVQEAFSKPVLSTGVGLLVALTGIVSGATLVNGFAGYFREFITVSNVVIIPSICVLLCATAAWGIAQSITVAVTITVAEVLGLLAVMFVALPDAIVGTGSNISIELGSLGPVWLGVLSGAGIAFYAFIGFEDMVNVAEEVKDVRRSMPRAIIVTLSFTALVYVAVAVIAVRAVPLSVLATSEAPLALMFEHTTGVSGIAISFIALFAVINGALIQIVMASRVLYGAASQGWIPGWLGQVNQRTKTPVVATLVVTILILGFAMWLPLGTLARLTALVILLVFTTVNLALIIIKQRDSGTQPEPTVYKVSLWVPAIGASASFIFVVLNVLEVLGLY